MLTQSSSAMLTERTITIPITAADRQLAQEFSQAQLTPQRQRQVYHNTLATCAVKTYLEWMDVPINLTQSYSHRSRDRFALDVADLYLPGLGRLECRMVEADAPHCQIPPEVQTDRLGYVAVKVDANATEAELIGFLSPEHTTVNLNSIEGNHLQVPLRNFAPLDQLLEALEPRWIKLGNWLQQEFEAHWQSLQDLARSQPQCAFLTHSPMSITTTKQLPDLLQELELATDDETRWRIIDQIWAIDPQHPATGVRRISDQGFYLDGASVALMVAVLPKPNQEYSLLMRLYPIQNALLPEALQLSGLYETGESFVTVQSRAQDNYIQFKFTAEAGERFGIRVKAGEAEITEFFIVPE